jgi:PAS domain S-box-containing protein
MKLVDLLATQAERITAQWVERTWSLAPQAPLSPAQRVDSLPLFLEELARALRQLEEGGAAAALPERSPVARAHGRQRQALGYAASAVAREYPLLHEVLLEQAQAAGVPVQAAESLLLVRSMGTATAEALSHFAAGQEPLLLLREASAARDGQAAAQGALAGVQAAEARARDSEALVRSLLDSTSEGLWGVASDGRCIFANPACVRLLGYDSDAELLGQDMHALTHHTRRDGTPYPQEECRVYEAFRTGRDVAVDDEVMWRKDGSPLEVRLRSSPIVLRGKTLGAVVAFDDVTAQRRAGAALRESEARFRRLDEAGIIGIIEWRAGGTITAANDAFLQMLGYSREDLARGALDFRTLTAPGSREVTEQGVRALRETGVVLPFEKQYLHRDGHPVDVLLSSATLDETRERAIALVLDISGRKRLEAALRASEERLRLVLATTGAGTFDLDLSTRDMRFDARMRELTHLPPGEVVDVERALGQVHPEERPAVEAAFGRALSEGAPFVVEHRVTPRRPEEPERWLSVRGGALPGTDGKPVRFVGLGMDVTAEKGRASFEQQLVGIASHDLRSPLQAILLSAQALLRNEALDARTTRGVVRIQTSAERALRLVRDLLDFTHARLGGGIPVQRRALELHALVRGVVEELEAAYPERVLRQVHAGDGQGAWDGDRLAQLVENLVSNALKYSPEDSAVEVRTRGEADAVVLEVHNAGEPIAPALLPRIFEPLQRATTAADGQSRSVGLGLYIVKHLAEAHGGRIAVRSTQEAGTTFTVWLPRGEKG